MAILKKIKGSTLMETLVATVLIVIIFMLSSMILNNLFTNTVDSNTQIAKSRLNELKYFLRHEKIKLPYAESYQGWNITIESFDQNKKVVVEFEAVNLKTNKTLTVQN